MTEEDLYQRALEIRDLVFAEDSPTEKAIEVLTLRLKALELITLTHIEDHLWQLCEQAEGINTGISEIRDILEDRKNT